MENVNTNKDNTFLSTRREIFFAYDIKMGNPNGDPDENRPRILPDGTFYVTDVRLKRFIRDYFKMTGKKILVDTIDEKTTNLTRRVIDYLEKEGKTEVQGKELVDVLLEAFIDARLFGSSFAFTEKKLKPIPKTLTGAIQFNHGEVLHEAEAVDIHGTTTFGSNEEKSQGTFTTYFGLRYGLIGFNGIANEHSAKISKMTDDDYNLLLTALWKSVRSCGNTRTKVGQVPRLLISIEYKPDVEFQFGNLLDYISLESVPCKSEKSEKEWSGPDDYLVDLETFNSRVGRYKDKIEKISYCKSPDINFKEKADCKPGSDWTDLKLDNVRSTS